MSPSVAAAWRSAPVELVTQDPVKIAFWEFDQLHLSVVDPERDPIPIQQDLGFLAISSEGSALTYFMN
jgi:hypothetical protein